MKITILTISFLLIHQLLYSAPKIIVGPKKTHYVIGKNIEYYEDKKGTLGIEDISSPEFQKKFISSKVDAPNFGFTPSVYWIKFDIQSNFDEKEKLFLELVYPLMDQIELFIPGENNNFDIKKTGDIFPFEKREVIYRNFVFKIFLLPGETHRYYMRFKSESSMQFPFIIWTPTSFAQKINKEIYILGIYYGILLSMLFYNLFIFLSVREKGYVFYVFYVLAFGLVQLCFNGLAFEYLWPNLPWWANKSVPFLIGFAYFAALPFSRSYLKTKSNVPFLDKILLSLTGLSVLVMALSLVLSYALSIKIAVVYAILSSLSIIISGTACVFKKYRPAYFYMLAWTMFMLGVILFALLHFGLLQLNFFTEYGMHLGSSMEVMLLSFGLADRINTEKREKYLAKKKSLENEKLARIAQQEAIENLHKADKLKEELNKNLEKKVEERTSELNKAMQELTVTNENLTATRNALWGEMALAKKIQTVLLPMSPKIPGFEVIGHMIPADEVGGDYYDVINADGISWVIIGDVSGHGFTSGLIMMMVQTCIRNTLQINSRIKPSTLLSVVNDTIYDNIEVVERGKYMTITAFAIYPDGKTIFSGLHQDILAYRSAKGYVRNIETQGTWLGLNKNIRKHLQNHSFVIKNEDTILLYTDGITEAWQKDSEKDTRSPENDMYGQKRLKKLFETHSNEALSDIKNQILEDLNQFEINDDVTFVLIRRKS